MAKKPLQMNKNYIFGFIFICILGILFFRYWMPDPIRAASPQSFTFHKVDRNTFQTIMQTEIVVLPYSLIGVGIKNNDVYIYSTRVLSPNFDVEARFMNTLKYWTEYIHPSLHKQVYTFVLCTFDGYGERIPHHTHPITYKKFPDETFEDKQEISVPNPYVLPILHKDQLILAYAKKPNDVNTMAIPDRYYTEQHGYENTIIPEVDKARIPWSEKKSLCVWRGSLENGTSCNFIGKPCHEIMNQRKFFVQLYQQGSLFGVEYNTSSLTKAEQMKYKYILDIDGWSTTWDGTFWKLYSGSVMLKCKSGWKQWYYDDLKEYVHYVPVENDLSNLNQQIEWCKTHDKECQEIVKKAEEFVKTKLNWQQVMKDTIEEANRRLG
jgi:hypothetical protein